VAGFPRRRARSDRKARDRVIDAIKRQLETPPALAVFCELVLKLFSERREAMKDAFFGRDRFSEFQRRVVFRRQGERRQRFGREIERLVEPFAEALAETRGERRARQAVKLADGFEPKAFEAFVRFIIKTQYSDGKVRKRLL